MELDKAYEALKEKDYNDESAKDIISIIEKLKNSMKWLEIKK